MKQLFESVWYASSSAVLEATVPWIKGAVIFYAIVFTAVFTALFIFTIYFVFRVFRNVLKDL